MHTSERLNFSERLKSISNFSEVVRENEDTHSFFAGKQSQNVLKIKM